MEKQEVLKAFNKAFLDYGLEPVDFYCLMDSYEQEVVFNSYTPKERDKLAEDLFNPCIDKLVDAELITFSHKSKTFVTTEKGREVIEDCFNIVNNEV